MRDIGRRCGWLSFALVALTLALTAAASAQDWQAGAGENWKTVLEAARKEGKVVVAGDVSPLSQTMAAAFKRDTGIDMELIVGRVGEVMTRVEREVRAGNVTIDVSFGGGTDVNLAREGLLVPIKPQLMLPGVTDPKNWIGGKIIWFDKTGEYLFQGSNWVHVGVVYNPKVVDAKSLTSWKDLLKPEFKGKIAAADPRGAGPGQATAAYVVETLGVDFLKQLYVGQEVTYTRDNRQLAEWVARGSYPIGLGAIPSFIELFRSQGLDIAVPDMADGPGSLVGGFSVVKETKGVPHPNAATVFLNWYASKPGQEVFSKGTLEASTRADVKVPEVPDYVIPKPGLKYFNQYEQDWFLETRPKLGATILGALGGR